MSTPLIDFRGKVTPQTDAVLEAIHRATGRDKSEIAREWLHRAAAEVIDTSIEVHRSLRREGLLGEQEGGPGK